MLYHELLIRLEPAPGGGYLARLMGPAVGQGSGPLDLKIDESLLPRLAEGFERGARATEEGAARVSEEGELLELGRKLRDALFSPPIRDALFELWGKIGEGGLRIRLQADPQATPLFALPWEALLWPNREDFLSLDRRAVLVRAIDLPVSCLPFPLQGPLRILVVASAPSDQARLDLAGEIRQLEDAVSCRERASVTVVEQADLGALRAALVSGSFHVLHFMGHGDLDPASGKGRLLFEREDGTSHPVLGEDLALQLKGIPSLRMVVLNACRTACAAHAGPFASVGAALLRAEIPAVVAMQFPLSDQAALAFSRELYGRLAAGDPLEAAVAEGRLALHRVGPGSGEWVTPVLFLRAADGKLFDTIPPLPPPPPRRWISWLLLGLLLLGILIWSASRGVTNLMIGRTGAAPPAAGVARLPEKGIESAPKTVPILPAPDSLAPRKARPTATRPTAKATTAPLEEVTLAEGRSLPLEGRQAALSIHFLDKDLQEMLGYKHEATVRLHSPGSEDQKASLLGPRTVEFQIDGKTVRIAFTAIDWDAKTVRLLLPQAL